METKKEIRSRLKKQRDLLGADECRSMSHDIFKRLMVSEIDRDYDNILLYSAIRNEVNTDEYFTYLINKAKRIYYPRVSGDKMSFYRVRSLDELNCGSFNIKEPDMTKEYTQADFGSVFTRNTSNGKNGNKGNRHIDTEKIEKIVAAKEKLSGYLTQLAEKGMPQSVIDELLSLDPLEAVEYARMLLKNPSKFDSIKNLAERDQAAAKKLAEASVASEDALKEAGEKGGNTYASGFINAVGTAISAALPNLSGIGIAVNNAEQSKQKAEQNKQDNYTAQTVEAMNVAQTTALLEGIASMLNTAISEKGITISFNPTIETSVNMDGETVAKNVTKKQTEHTVRTNG